MNLGELLHAQAVQRPNAPALFCADQEMSFGELDESSSRLACRLIEQGLEPGDRVAIHWCNSLEVVQILFAVFKAGLIAVPVNIRLKAPEVAWILGHTQSAVCFCSPALASNVEQARSSCASLRQVLTELPPLRAEQGSALPEVEEDWPAVILYTSGSTGRPRGAVHTHQTMCEATRLITESVFDRDDVVLTMTQMMHAVGLGLNLLPALSLGRPAVLLPAFDPAAVLDAIERFGCTCTLGLPALLQFVVEEQLRKPRNTSSLRIVGAGGDRVPADLQQRFETVFGVPLFEGYGMSESYLICLNPQDAKRPGSIGIPPRGIDVRIVNAQDEDLPEGDTGEIIVRSAANCTGYWNDPAATAALLRDNWLHTGDLACRDSDGYVWFRGRKKEIIIRGGSNISPQEVEEALYDHPAIFEAGVIGVPDPIYGERVVAFVSLRNGTVPAETELRDHARACLADYKVPEKFLFIPELPKGTTGKIHRPSLKSMLPSLINEK